MDPNRSFRNTIRSLSHYFRQIDRMLFATVVAICVLSALNLYGVTGGDVGIVSKHIVLLLVSIGAMILLSFFNYRYFKNYSLPVIILYTLSLLLVVLTLVFPPIRGIHAWIVIGQFTFEASELAKLTLVILLAKYFSQRHAHINQFRHIFASGLYVGVPILLILVQPDLGSAAIVGLVWVGVLIASGINKKHLLILAGAALILCYIAWIFGLQQYQKDRILAFINPYRDPSGIGYNIIQSKIAIGSGRWLGSGLGNGSQATLGFLPEANSDFVFAAYTEQFGWVGVVVLYGLLFFLLWRILQMGQESTNNFGKLFSIGLAIIIFAHVAVSSAVNLGLMPITGIPFTFLSYGGSHLISVMMGIGILQSIKRYG